MPTRYKIGTTAEIPADGDRLIREIDGLEIAVFKIDGEYYALSNYCVHQGGPLCEGDLTGRITMSEDKQSMVYDEREHTVMCPWHGWLFDVKTGVNVDADSYRTPTFPVEVDDDEIYVVR